MKLNITIITLSLLLLNCSGQTTMKTLSENELIEQFFQNETKLSPTLRPNTSYRICDTGEECVSTKDCDNPTLESVDVRWNLQRCPLDMACCKVQNHTRQPLTTPSCGYRHPEGIFAAIGDVRSEVSKIGEFPWMVSILKHVGAERQYLCAGALIAPTVVITSYHNIVNESAVNLNVRAGEWDMETTNQVPAHQDRSVAEIISHENYVGGNSFYNDIAILILSTPFEYQATIQPICLPQANINFDGARCLVAGWGKNRFGRNGSYQKTLKKIELPVVPRAQCEADLRLTRLSKYFDLHESAICAGGEKDIDACTGDGGAPLMCPIVGGAANRYYHAGIVSWGIECGVERVPGVYTSITHQRDWISRKLLERRIDFAHFTP